jgi:hypothetical protein
MVRFIGPLRNSLAILRSDFRVIKCRGFSCADVESGLLFCPLFFILLAEGRNGRNGN